jgi:hypothetical protein
VLLDEVDHRQSVSGIESLEFRLQPAWEVETPYFEAA